MFDDIRPLTGIPHPGGVWRARLEIAALVLSAWWVAVTLGGILFWAVSQITGSSSERVMWGALVVGLASALAFVTVGLACRDARWWLFRILEVGLFVVLPAWGVGINAELAPCDECDETPGPALAMPAGALVLGAYVIGLVAYVMTRVRRKPLSVSAEAALLASLWMGMLTCLLLTVHFGFSAVVGVIIGIVGLPLGAPSAIAAIWFAVSIVRLARHPQSLPVASGAAFVLMFGTGGAAIANRVFYGRWDLFAGALTETCDWTFSQLTPPPQDCHYLCTVAAQGHPWLVRPIRIGMRRGRPILVNRQLAVANAFEDLLHERCPRFGQLARRTYDRLAFPVNPYLLHPVAADVVFVLMLPVQAMFELILRAFDAAPEARIDRMYPVTSTLGR